MGLISRLGKLSAEGGLMLKGPVLNLSVLHSSVFQDRPDRGCKICLKKVLKDEQLHNGTDNIRPGPISQR